MLKQLNKLYLNQGSVKEFENAIRQGIPSAMFGVPDPFKSFLVSTLDNPVVYVVKDIVSARSVVAEIQAYSDKKVVYLPPKDEILLTQIAYSKDSIVERVCALSNLKDAEVIVVTPETLLQTVPLKVESLTLEKEQDYDLAKLKAKLVQMGYVYSEQIDVKGTFSVRGDVLDIFPINAVNPYRIDFFGDTIENVREFDIETSKTLKSLQSVDILQTQEFIFTNEQFELFNKAMKAEKATCEKSAKERITRLIDDLDLSISQQDSSTIQVFSALTNNKGWLFDLMDRDYAIVFDESKRVLEVLSLYEKEFNERHEWLVKSGNAFAFTSQNLLSVEQLKQKIKEFRLCAISNLATAVTLFNPLNIINSNVSVVGNYQLDFNQVYLDISNWLKSGYDILVCTENMSRAERFCLDLSKNGIASSILPKNFQGVAITPERLSKGFVYHELKKVIIGSGNLFTKPPVQKSSKGKKAFFSAPTVGDFCVHEVHGVGKVLGNKKISTTEGTKDYVSVLYDGGDMLYIPVEQMDILTKYLGGEKTPRLSKIGGKDFERIKNSVRESIKKMSFSLKELYQKRESVKGFRFTEAEELQTLFENSFAFEDTVDQQTATRDIKEDMLSDKVMDRLVCGDVGFGKTEVAFRAVFRCIANGKQAVMLAPTTILTEQHFNTAVERFSPFGIKVACLNRFKTPKQQKQILADLKEGKIEFIIGTHRLLSKDVEFKDLGLLVLDEEQRFGVEHKEKIKLLKNDVDTLTLTATPIPRTLHMSLSGIRQISTITTPPKKRLPVQTYVTEQTEELIKDALLKEYNRGGQSFVLYNRVESICKFANSLSELLPELKITVAHGQMAERELESNIMQFYQGKSDVLVSTTIIENGIDLKRANTLIVTDADRLGLSTLYQLKGRVGRSDRLAYAYFTFQREKILTDQAYERLNAISDFAGMGSGIKIAMRDLEIRGAGNILGAEQHGHMDKIGYELYSKLLKEEMTETVTIVPELDVRVSSFIPEDYIESNTARMDAYKEIAEIDSDKSERELKNWLFETYGSLPMPVQNLIDIASVKRLASKLAVEKVCIKNDQTSITFANINAFSNQKLVSAIEDVKHAVRLTMTKTPTLEFSRSGENNSDMLNKVKKFLLSATK